MDMYFFDESNGVFKQKQNTNSAFDKPELKNLDAIKSKISQLYHLSQEGKYHEFQEEIKLINSYKNGSPNLFKKEFRKLDLQDLEKTCYANYRLEKITTKKAKSLSDIVDMIQGVEKIELHSFYYPSYNVVKEKISKVSKKIKQTQFKDVVENSLKQLYLLSDENDFVNYHYLKDTFSKQINLIYNHGINLNEILEKSKSFENNKQFLFNTLDYFDFTKEEYDPSKTIPNINILEFVQRKILTQFPSFYEEFINIKEDTLKKNIHHHLTNAFHYAQQLKGKKLMSEIDVAETLMIYLNIDKECDLMIIENVYRKEKCDNILSKMKKNVKTCTYEQFFKSAFNFKDLLNEIQIYAITQGDMDYIMNKEEEYKNVFNELNKQFFNKARI